LGRGAGSPSNTMWPGPRPTCRPGYILIHRTVWLQYTKVTDRQTDRQDRQRSDSIGRTVFTRDVVCCIARPCFSFLSVRLSVSLSVTRRYCAKEKAPTVKISIPHDSLFIVLSPHRKRLATVDPFHAKFGSQGPTPLPTRTFSIRLAS